VRRALAAIGVLLLLLAAVVLVKTALFTSKQGPVEPAAPLAVDREQLAARLAEAIRFRTISNPDPAAVDAPAFLGLRAHLERSFPRAHAALTREVIGDHTLLFTWTGSEATLKPLLLMAHQDVVPVEPGTETAWTHPPFEGRITGGYIWGRGTLDDKSGVLSQLEAVELLLTQSWQPRRTVHLAFGHDEEIAGTRGAAAVAALFRSRGIELEYVMDEGLVITVDALKGVPAPVALVGIAEKGSVVVELSVRSPGGHSSMPPPSTAIGILSAAVHRLEVRQFPARLDGVAGSLFAHVGPEMPFLQRLVLANLWLSRRLLLRQLAASPGTNAVIRTTTAVTQIDGGVKENVLPSQARAIVNFRTLPGDGPETVVEHVRTAIGDPRVVVRALDSSAASPVSSLAAPSYRLVERTIRQVFPEVIVAPGLFVALSDSRHFGALSPSVYRFRPWRATLEDLRRIHGTDERISVADYEGCVRFYVQLLRNSTR
jgi:carboxypeptidase PM20D1